jgi:hypothetical protein
MIEENISADDFLLKIDQELKERAAAEQALKENRKQRAQKMFSEAENAIDVYMNALGRRHFGAGNYEIKHVFDDFSGAYWTVYSVEKKDWNVEMRYSGDDKDIHLHEYRFKEGFKVDLVYSSEDEKGILTLFHDGEFIPFSDECLKETISKIHQKGPHELLGHF